MTDSMEEKSETTRKLIEWAIAVGRSCQSTQTGYLHYYYGLPQKSNHQTIPIYENILFALALLRSRQIENIKEAQNILTRLLVFQCNDSTPSHGNFPVYLHEYPFCRDFSCAVRILAPFYWILVGFRHILGNELRSHFEKCVENLIQYGLNANQVRPFPYSIAVRFAAGLIALGGLFGRKDWNHNGLQWLDLLGNKPAEDSWCHTDHLADLLIAAQMAPAEFNLPNWKSLWSFIVQTWQPELACYCGPNLYEKQDQSEPEVSLYDLYLGYLTGKLSGRAQKLKFVHLQGALIHPSNLEIKPVSVDVLHGLFNGENWSCIKQKDWAITLLEKTLPLNEKREKNYTPLRLLWGNKDVTHSFVCQGGEANCIKYDWKDSAIEMVFDLESVFESNLESGREISFYFDMYADLTITVKDHRTNTFELGQIVKLQLGGNKEIQINFELLEGKGHFLGHITQANRPSQISQMEEKKPQIFDWILFLRTLRRSDHCKLKVTIKIEKM